MKKVPIIQKKDDYIQKKLGWSSFFHQLEPEEVSWAFVLYPLQCAWLIQLCLLADESSFLQVSMLSLRHTHDSVLSWVSINICTATTSRWRSLYVIVARTFVMLAEIYSCMLHMLRGGPLLLLCNRTCPHVENCFSSHFDFMKIYCSSPVPWLFCHCRMHAFDRRTIATSLLPYSTLQNCL